MWSLDVIAKFFLQEYNNSKSHFLYSYHQDQTPPTSADTAGFDKSQIKKTKSFIITSARIYSSCLIMLLEFQGPSHTDISMELVLNAGFTVHVCVYVKGKKKLHNVNITHSLNTY